jgi:hypothetical protein
MKFKNRQFRLWHFSSDYSHTVAGARIGGQDSWEPDQEFLSLYRHMPFSVDSLWGFILILT